MISLIFKRVSHEELIRQYKMPALAEADIEVLQLYNRKYLIKQKVIHADFLISPKMWEDIFHQLSDLPRIKRIFIATVDYGDEEYYPLYTGVDDCKLTMFIGPSLDLDASIICALEAALSQCRYLDIPGSKGKQPEGMHHRRKKPVKEYFDRTQID